MANRIDCLMLYYKTNQFDLQNKQENNSYYIRADQRVLNGIRSIHDTPAYQVDVKTQFDSAEEAEKALDEMYGHNSIYLSNKADRDMKDATKDLQLRSMFVYAGQEENPDYYNFSKNQEQWADFKSNATYQKMASQGGTKSQSDVDELITAAEEYRWQKAYKENDVYEQDMYDFAASLKERTGVTLITSGTDNKVAFEMDGMLCKVDNFTFQMMAKNQDHMDIWDDMVSGKYKNFGEVADAVMATNDEKLKTDWSNTIFEAQYNHNFSSQSSKYTTKEYVSVTYSNQDQSFDANVKGRTAGDFWNEIQYNMGHSNKFSSERDYNDYMESGDLPKLMYLYDDILQKSNHEVGFRVDKDGNFYGLRTGRLISTKEQREGEVTRDYSTQRIDTLKAKIKDAKAKLSKLEGSSKSVENGEATNSNSDKISDYKSKISLYENQISIIQASQLSAMK